MPFTVFLSGHLKSFSGGGTEFVLGGEPATVGEALAALWADRPALRDRILNEQGEIRRHVNVFYKGRDVRRSAGLDTKIGPGEELHIFNAVSGG
jgi:molybdopterin synthase sulfur carrier subunit